MSDATGPAEVAGRPGDGWREAVRACIVPRTAAGDPGRPRPALEPEMFRWRPDEDAKAPVRPSRRRALEALPAGGSVLDVGVGGGASSFGLAHRAGLIVGVDPLQGMLDLFADTARTIGIACRAVLGGWPDVAGEVEPADVAVCHHAIYLVEEIEDFLTTLTARARHRVVVELSAHSPLTRFNPVWKALHGTERPDPLIADEAHAVLLAMGLAVEREDLVMPARAREVTPQFVEFVRTRVGVGPDRDAQIEQVLRELQPVPDEIVALWWPGRG